MLQHQETLAQSLRAMREWQEQRQSSEKPLQDEVVQEALEAAQQEHARWSQDEAVQ